MTVTYEVETGLDHAPILMSHSRRTGYLRCPNQLRLKKAGFPVKPAVALIAGTAFHWACDLVDQEIEEPVAAWARAWFSGLEDAAAVEPDDTLWKVSGRASKAKPNKEDIEWWGQAGADMVVAYAAYRETERNVGFDIWTQPDSTLAIEVPFEFPMAVNGLNINVRGSIDRVLVQDGTFIIRDHKTSQRQPNDDGQLGIYKLAMQHLYDIDVQWGDYYMARESSATTPVSLTHYTEELWAAEYGAVAKAMRDQLYPANPGDHCGYCEVRDGCAIKGGVLAKDWAFSLPK